MPCHPDRCRRHYRTYESTAEAVALDVEFAAVRARIAAVEAAHRVLPWQRPSDNAAEQLLRRAGVTANVIEGDDLWGV